MRIKVAFEIGHSSYMKSKATPDGYTHDWELFVRGSDGSNISRFVDRVVFNLHESFPRPCRGESHSQVANIMNIANIANVKNCRMCWLETSSFFHGIIPIIKMIHAWKRPNTWKKPNALNQEKNPIKFLIFKFFPHFHPQCTKSRHMF